MFWFRATSFFKFLWGSTNQYGIHSPFIYQFLIKCLYKKIPKPDVKDLKENRSLILNSTEVVEVKDFGSGSVQFSTHTRSVGDMARKAGMSIHKSKLIHKIVRYFEVKSTLELGTSAGLGSIAMATNQLQNSVETVESCPNTFRVTKQNIDKLQLRNIRLFNSTFQDFFNGLSKVKKYDLVYIDGHHDEDATLEYFSKVKQHIHKKSIVILDDIYWSKGMQNAWSAICKDDSVKVSIDLYFWGILFFKPGLSKQDFKIRCFI